MLGRYWIAVGAILGGVSVGLGAFAAHGLDQVFVEKYAGQTRVVAGETMPLATKFFNHAVSLLVVGLWAERRASRSLEFAGRAFFVGVVLFSGSLYILTLTGVTKWGMVTPLGGVALIAGWLTLAVESLRNREI